MRVRNAQIQHLIESTGSKQSLVKQIRPIRGANDKYSTSASTTLFIAIAHAVQFGEKLADNAVHDASTISLIPTLGRDRVQLIKEDDAGPCISCALKDTSHIRFALPDVHVQQLRTLHGKEIQAELGGDGLGQQRLARARRTVEEDAAALLQTFCEQLWSGQW